MAPGGKAFIIFNFPPGVSLFCSRTKSADLLCPGEKALRGARVLFAFKAVWFFASSSPAVTTHNDNRRRTRIRRFCDSDRALWH
jgi:hypothetical protein